MRVRFLRVASVIASGIAIVLSASGAAMAASKPASVFGLKLVPAATRVDARTATMANTGPINIENYDLQCLDADSNHWGQNGDNVQLWSCNSNGEQVWRLSGNHIVNSDGQCLDADSTHWGQNGDNVQLWSCNSNGEQSWQWSGNHIVNSDGQCLDADSTHWGQNGDNVQLWSCNSNGEQTWQGAL
jgi:streptogrisin C